MLRCNAEVVRCSPHHVWVKLDQEQACAGCIKTSCKIGSCTVKSNKQGKIIKLPLIESQFFLPGEIVSLAFSENEFIKNTVLWFGIPLAMLFLSLAIMQKTIAPTEGLMVQAGIIGLSYGLLFARKIVNWRMKQLFIIYRSTDLISRIEKQKVKRRNT